ncbi:hypothetical protein D7B24_008164 [Verticillium nonalfalfae]|uniref:Uncharacterized protein n=1 Tax=Verticillium nonalfalfae TaxID=1051616 RepID=A0A3M9YKJ0_9PEZI|nr:uncharacterized protein D7B24_008164 [Verticillium nonalfalfae]RNJ60472.1 hypothetical protein D7B24_008164 [Verticillium nonalfalfae]
MLDEPMPGPYLVRAPAKGSTPEQRFEANKTVLRDIIEVDHFSNTVPESIVSLWLNALNPRNKTPLPRDVKGFYGGDLRASIPIELAHDCYKYVIHETDKTKVDKYANRMLIALSLLDMEDLSKKDANLAGLALWHTALAQARLPGSLVDLSDTLKRYEAIRPRASLSDSKLPQPLRLVARLLTAAEQLGNAETVVLLQNWKPENSTSSSPPL